MNPIHEYVVRYLPQYITPLVLWQSAIAIGLGVVAGIGIIWALELLLSKKS